jgi:predicted AlkP superfamily phosphohydrolase/phosphomutase
VSKSTRNAAFNKFLSFGDIDWSRTEAYSLGHMGQIYINVKGREPAGIVARGADYERAMERVITALRTLRTDDGRPMLDRVIRSSELPHGAHQDESADLHVVLDGYRYISCPLFATDQNVISKQIRGDSGCHRMNGAFIAYGPHIRAGVQVKDARIVDLAPTALHLLDCPIPDDMDGHVLNDLFNGKLARRSPQIAAAGDNGRQKAYVLSKDEEAELEDRLKGLGYLG